MIYKVNILYKGQDNFIVEANTKAEAEMIARHRWRCGMPDILGTEFEIASVVVEPVNLNEKEKA